MVRKDIYQSAGRICGQVRAYCHHPCVGKTSPYALSLQGAAAALILWLGGAAGWVCIQAVLLGGLAVPVALLAMSELVAQSFHSEVESLRLQSTLSQ